jgi:arylsulfatase
MNHRLKTLMLPSLFRVLGLLVWVLGLPVAVSAQDQPNVVLMMMDNYGYGELGVYGGGVLRGAETPRLDELASEGLRLTNFNVEPQCTPSRSALMTGRHPIRSGTTRVVWGVLYGMVQWEVTMAEMMHDAGYATGMFGKWHLGDIQGRFPTDQGFDEWYGIPNTTDESLYTSHPQFDRSVGVVPEVLESRRGEVPTFVKEYDLEARRLIDGEATDRTIDFMREQTEAGTPFFAYVPFTQAHLPTLPHPDFDGTTGYGAYADVSAEIDYRAGQILDAIDDLGIRDNTIVIWTSDNGPEEIPGYQGTAGFWRGHYFTALEGSLRVPFMVRWPGRIEAGRVSNEMVHMVDLFPTLAHAVSGGVPDDRIIDGIDQLDFFVGAQEGSDRVGFPVYNGDEMFAYKWGDWKLHLIELNSMLDAPARLNFPKLHNLISDPKELYPITETDVSAAWVLPPLFTEIVNFQRSLVAEPPIQLGTPDPYVPGND